MRILIASDAWHPQVNGVVRSLEAVAHEARAMGSEVEFLTHEGFRTFGLPSYPGIRLALAGFGEVRRRIAAARPDHVHIATEGPIGLAARAACLRDGRIFTTSYHTHFPDYIAARLPIPRSWSYAVLRRFHNAGAGVMVSTARVAEDLRARGFRNILRWSRGVDSDLYRPRSQSVLDLPRPIFLFVGRIAVEKNLEAFLQLDLPGSKVVVGDGPARADLEAQFPDAHFLGQQTGDALARLYSSADVFVFPSRTDTFGIVLLEALASGVPVAAFPVMGPLDVIGESSAGVLDDDLGAACRAALLVDRAAARQHALEFSWRESAQQFLANVESAHGNPERARVWGAAKANQRTKRRPSGLSVA